MLCEASSAVELITNGNFESCTSNVPAGWSRSGTSVVCATPMFAGSGYGLLLGGATNNTDSTLSQIITTTAGRTYTFTFRYSYLGTDNGQRMLVSLTGATNISPSLATPLTLTDYTAPQTYTGTFQATGNSVTVAFTDNTTGTNGFQNNGFNSDMIIDDVSVSYTSPTNAPIDFSFNHKQPETFATEIQLK